MSRADEPAASGVRTPSPPRLGVGGRKRRMFVLFFSILVMYLFLAQLSWINAPASDQLTYLWLPTALVVGILARVSRVYQVPVLAAAVLGEVLTDALVLDISNWGLLFFVAANTCEQLIAAEIIRRYRASSMQRVRDVATLFLAGLIAATIGASVGAAATFLFSNSSVSVSWQSWFLGSLLGILVLTPLVLTAQLKSELRFRVVIEATSLGISMVFLSMLALLTTVPGAPALLALLLPILVWLGYRFGVAGIAIVAPSIAYITITAAAQGLGVFDGQPLGGAAMVYLQLWLMLLSLVAYAAAAMETDRHATSRLVRQARADLEYQATHDHVTGLYNRFAIHERMAAALTPGLMKGSGGGTLLAVDLDGFVSVNDTAGHALGDALLATTAERISIIAPAHAEIARLGGDEFWLFIPEVLSTTDMLSLARQLRRAIQQPMSSEAREFILGACIGGATLTGDERVLRSTRSRPVRVTAADVRADELKRRADLALTNAREQGANSLQVYSEALESDSRAAMQLRSELITAIENECLEVWGQNLIQASDHRIVGCELLARIYDQDGHPLPTDQVIPLAESTGLIIPLGLKLRQAGLRIGQASLPAPVQMSFNISGRELAEISFTTSLLHTLEAADIDLDRVILEVTETAVLTQPKQTQRGLRQLRRAGVKIALDDFGTGFSSLSLLREFPCDIVKIDHSFVRDVPTSAAASDLLQAIIDMSHAIDAICVAEGIETDDQADAITAMGCDWLQGFGLHRPEPLQNIVVPT